MERHIQSDTGKTQFKCRVCSFKTLYLISINRHLKSAKYPLEQCHLCDFKSCTHQAMINHKKELHLFEPAAAANVTIYTELQSHPSPSPFNRQTIAIFDISWKVLKRSKLLVISEDKVTMEMINAVAQSLIDDSILLEDYYRCQHCDFCSKDASHFQEHILSRKPGTQLQCHLCNFKSCTAHGITNHAEEMHSSSRFGFEVVPKIEPLQATAVENTLQEALTPQSPQNLNASRLKGKPRFQCTLCTKQYDRLRNLEYHIRTHTGERPFQCKRCSYSAIIESALKKHNRFSNNPVQHCLQCELTFCSEISLQRHVNSSHLENNFFGPVLLEAVQHPEDEPMDDQVMPEPMVEEELETSICENIEVKPPAMKRLHMDFSDDNLREIHSEEKASSSKQLQQIRPHLAQTPLVETIEDSVYNKFELQQIQFRLFDNEDLENESCLEEHLSIDTSKRLIQCKRCSYTSDRKAEVLKHQESRASKKGKFYSCSKCTFKSCTPNYLLKHLKENHPEEDVTSFKQLREDVDTSATEGASVELKGIEKQPEIHKVQELCCPYCQRKFRGNRRKQNFVDHIRIHTGEKPYKCNQCPYASTQNSGLYHHKRRNHLPSLPIHRKHSKGKSIHKRCNSGVKDESLASPHKQLPQTGRPDFLKRLDGKKKTKSDKQQKKTRASKGKNCERKKYVCTVCDLEFSDFFSFAYHRQTHLIKKPC